MSHYRQIPSKKVHICPRFKNIIAKSGQIKIKPTQQRIKQLTKVAKGDQVCKKSYFEYATFVHIHEKLIDINCQIGTNKD